jgi:hypothetical protein
MWANRLKGIAVAVLPQHGRTAMNRAPLIFAAMVVLSGCATQAQRQFEAIKTGKQAIGAQFKYALTL